MQYLINSPLYSVFIKYTIYYSSKLHYNVTNWFKSISH